MRKFFEILSDRRRDERGATFVLTAVSMVLLLWGGAMGVDLGMSVVGGREAQAQADTSALDMARYIDVLDSTAQASAATSLATWSQYAKTDNTSNAVLTVTPGLWKSGTFTANGLPNQGCFRHVPPAGSPCNAFKVTAAQPVPQIFSHGSHSVSRSAIAAVTPMAAFSVSSFLFDIGTGCTTNPSSCSNQQIVLNALLSPLGTSANLQIAGYQGLATTNVTIKQLVTASGGLLTNSSVMTTSLTGAQWLAILSVALANQVASLNCGATPTPSPCTASAALGALNFSGSTHFQLCQLVSINGSTCGAGSTLSSSVLGASVNVLQILTTQAMVANGTNALDLGTSLGFPSVTDATLALTLGQLPQIAYGPTGTTASSAQINADLRLTVQGVGVLDIPLNGAKGTGTLQTISCPFNALSVTNIQPAGTAATATMTLTGLGTVGTMTASGYSGSVFGYGPSVIPPSATTAANDTNPISAGTATPTFTYSGLSGTLNPLVTNLLSVLATGLGPILQAVGVTVGGLTIAALATNCGAVSLVQ